MQNADWEKADKVVEGMGGEEEEALHDVDRVETTFASLVAKIVFLGFGAAVVGFDASP